MSASDMDHDQVKEQLEAYALGALDANEEERVAQHLAGCVDCRRLVQQYAESVSVLPQALAAASSLRPPSALKRRLLESVQAAPTPARLAGAEAPVQRAKWLTFRPRTMAVSAAGLLLALSLAWNIGASVALARERALRAEFASLVDQQEIVLEVVDGRNTVKASLRATESGSTSYGKLYTRPDLPHVVAMAGRLPLPAEGEAYHLWLTSQGQTQLGGLLTVNEQGFGLLVFDADENGPVYESARVTLQPVGSVGPSSPVLLWEAPS